MTTRAERRKKQRRSLNRFRNRLSLAFLLSLWTYSIQMLLAPPHIDHEFMDYTIAWRVPLYAFVWTLIIEAVYCEVELRKIEREIELERISNEIA